MVKFDSLLNLLLHILEHQLAVQLCLSQAILRFKSLLLFVTCKPLLYRLLQYMATLIIFDLILATHLVELGLLLFELHVELILNLKHFAFFVFHKCPFVMIEVGAELLVQLLHATVNVLL